MGSLVPSHRQQMERSRKRVMKAARNDYQQGLENQKVRFGSPMVSQLTDGSPQARLRCTCLYQAIQEAYCDVNNPRTRRLPFLFRAFATGFPAHVSSRAANRVFLVLSLFMHVNATTQVCLVVESRSHPATSPVIKCEECDLLAVKCICYCSEYFVPDLRAIFTHNLPTNSDPFCCIQVYVPWHLEWNFNLPDVSTRQLTLDTPSMHCNSRPFLDLTSPLTDGGSSRSLNKTLLDLWFSAMNIPSMFRLPAAGMA